LLKGSRALLDKYIIIFIVVSAVFEAYVIKTARLGSIWGALTKAGRLTRLCLNDAEVQL